MSYSYSGDPSNSERDKYRFLTGDVGEVEETTSVGPTPPGGSSEDDATPTVDFILTDEEIDFVLDNYTSHTLRLYFLYNSMSNKLARYYKKSLGPQYEDPTTKAKHFADLAKEYKAKAAASGITVPTYASDKTFAKGMHDNV